MQVAPQMPSGVRIRVSTNAAIEQNSQNPLVLLNGIGAGVDHWGNFVEAFEHDRPVVAIDVSRAQSCEYGATMGTYARAVAKTIDSLGLDKVDLLGVSWGGALAQETTLSYPNRVGKLVLAATLPGIGSIPPKLVAARALSTSDRTSAKYRSLTGRIYGGDIRTNPELLTDIGIKRQIDDSAYERQKWALLTWRNSVFSLTRIENPTLIMAGADDPISRRINSYMMRLAIPRSQLHVVPKKEGGGHLFLHTRPVASAAIINRFLG